MRLAIVFDVPDDGEYAGVAARMVEHHASAERRGIPHWTFGQEMRPVGAFAAEVDQTFADAARMAYQELDQDHPWVPGAVFRTDPRMKPLLMAFLSALRPHLAHD